ncbi:unnamed protein product, partial [Ectocarpus fasciculatus]
QLVRRITGAVQPVLSSLTTPLHARKKGVFIAVSNTDASQKEGRFVVAAPESCLLLNTNWHSSATALPKHLLVLVAVILKRSSQVASVLHSLHSHLVVERRYTTLNDILCNTITSSVLEGAVFPHRNGRVAPERLHKACVKWPRHARSTREISIWRSSELVVLLQYIVYTGTTYIVQCKCSRSSPCTCYHLTPRIPVLICA